MSSDPRGSLPWSPIHMPDRHRSRFLSSSRRSLTRVPSLKSQDLQCHDWMFSSATNVHIAIDKSTFRTFTPFDTYVLTVSGSNRVSVCGIGSVDLKIKCKPASHRHRCITLENVLYVPSWYCNIASDIVLSHNVDYRWTGNRLQFFSIDDKSRPWGYTEPFCGLDRLVLVKKEIGRSPMLEDKDREIWAINLNWPQSQRDEWAIFKARELQKMAKEHEAEILAQQCVQKTRTESTEFILPRNLDKSPNPKLKSASPISSSKVSIRTKMGAHVVSHTNGMSLAERMELREISGNVPVRRDVTKHFGSLKATFAANRGLLEEFLAAGQKR